MLARAFVGVVTLLGLTAFAPAPLPRRERAGPTDGVAVAHLQGRWAVTKLQMTRGGGALDDQGTYLAEVRIDGERWSFYYREGNRPPVNYALGIDHRASPAQINFYNGNAVRGTPYGTGIIRRQGGTVTVLYSWGSPRAGSFENPPSGHWVITLQRR